MLNERQKQEMLNDGLNPQRRQEFSRASRQKPPSSRILNDYIAFLMDMQKIKPFKRRRVVTSAEKNIL